MELNKIYNQECLEGLKLLPDECVDCIVTSPPYFNLRNYKIKGQIGLEKTVDEYTKKIIEVFEECKRVLKKEGTCWINLGDSYWGSGQGYGDTKTTNKNHNGSREREKPTYYKSDIKSKDMIGIPWTIAFALRANGWYLRQDIIWAKPNPMPESVLDRCTKSHEYLFLISKSQRYYFDNESIKTETEWDSTKLKMPDGWDTGAGGHGSYHREGREKGRTIPVGSSFDKGKTGEMKFTNGHKTKSGNKERKNRPGAPEHNYAHQKGSVPWEGMKANKRSVWTVSTKPFSEAHFATFPEDLIVDCIKAGCPEGGIVLDPFMGAGTTALVARKLNRNFIGFELNPEYIKIAEKRLYTELGMFL